MCATAWIGFGAGIVVIETLPELIKSLEFKYSHLLNNEIGDFASGFIKTSKIFNTFLKTAIIIFVFWTKTKWLVVYGKVSISSEFPPNSCQQLFFIAKGAVIVLIYKQKVKNAFFFKQTI